MTVTEGDRGQRPGQAPATGGTNGAHNGAPAEPREDEMATARTAPHASRCCPGRPAAGQAPSQATRPPPSRPDNLARRAAAAGGPSGRHRPQPGRNQPSPQPAATAESAEGSQSAESARRQPNGQPTGLRRRRTAIRPGSPSPPGRLPARSGRPPTRSRRRRRPGPRRHRRAGRRRPRPSRRCRCASGSAWSSRPTRPARRPSPAQPITAPRTPPIPPPACRRRPGRLLPHSCRSRPHCFRQAAPPRPRLPARTGRRADRPGPRRHQRQRLRPGSARPARARHTVPPARLPRCPRPAARAAGAPSRRRRRGSDGLAAGALAPDVVARDRIRRPADPGAPAKTDERGPSTAIMPAVAAVRRRATPAGQGDAGHRSGSAGR